MLANRAAYAIDFNPNSEHHSFYNDATPVVTTRNDIPRVKAKHIDISALKRTLLGLLESRVLGITDLCNIFSDPRSTRAEFPDFIYVYATAILDDFYLRLRENNPQRSPQGLYIPNPRLNTLASVVRSYRCSRNIEDSSSTIKSERYWHHFRRPYRLDPSVEYRVIVLHTFRYTLYDEYGNWINASNVIKDVIKQYRPDMGAPRVRHYANAIPLHYYLQEGLINTYPEHYGPIRSGYKRKNASRRPNSCGGISRYLKNGPKSAYDRHLVSSDFLPEEVPDCGMGGMDESWFYEELIPEPKVRAAATVKESWNMTRFENRGRRTICNWKHQRKTERQYVRA